MDNSTEKDQKEPQDPAGPTSIADRPTINDTFSHLMKSNATLLDPVKITPKHHHIATLTAANFKQTEIAKMVSMTPAYVSQLLKTGRMKALVNEKRTELGLDITAMIRKLVPEAIQEAYEIMTDPEVGPSTRLTAAKDFMDRGMGKAIQRIEQSDGSTIRELFNALDKNDLVIEKKQKILDVEPTGGTPEQSIIEVDVKVPGSEDLVTVSATSSSTAQVDSMVSWLEENFIEEDSADAKTDGAPKGSPSKVQKDGSKEVPPRGRK